MVFLILSQNILLQSTYLWSKFSSLGLYLHPQAREWKPLFSSPARLSLCVLGSVLASSCAHLIPLWPSFYSSYCCGSWLWEAIALQLLISATLCPSHFVL